MTRADDSSFLVKANVRRHEATFAAAHDAIEQLGREGRAVSFGAVAHTAGVSRTWLYRQEEIRDLIGLLRAEGPPTTARTAQRASADLNKQMNSWLSYTSAGDNTAADNVSTLRLKTPPRLQRRHPRTALS